MVMGHFAQDIKVEKLPWIDKVLIIITAVTVYHAIAHYNLGFNMSVREYGDHGALSVVLVAVIGVTGTIFYVALGWLVSQWGLAKKILLRVNRNAFAIMAMQFVYFEVLDYVMPEISSINEWVIYGYGVLKVMINLVLCVITGEIAHSIIAMFKNTYGRS